ncbi:universal stress protein [Candidatus Binatus sp.]|uniref:universal stress protein n=1 Tax=Candidatus Binatus sp. TaxID=2811406 RepID=UPI003C7436E3
MQLQGKVPCEFVVRTSEVVNEILAANRVFAADLIVIPTHGRRGLKSRMLGSCGFSKL